MIEVRECDEQIVYQYNHDCADSLNTTKGCVFFNETGELCVRSNLPFYTEDNLFTFSFYVSACGETELINVQVLAVASGSETNTTNCTEASTCVDCSPFPPEEDPFGEVPSQFNSMLFGNIECSGSSSEGRLAAAGSVNISDYSIGCKLFWEGSNCIPFGQLSCKQIEEADENPDTLVVGQNLNYARGEVKVGNVVYGGTLTADRMKLVSDCAAIHDPTLFNWGEWDYYMREKSIKLRTLPASGECNFVLGSLTCVGTNYVVDVFEVDPNILKDTRGVTLRNINPDASIIFNVAGKSLNMGNMGFNTGSYKCNNVIWNFYDAEVVTIRDVSWWGSILAPKAEIVDSNGDIRGQVFARSIYQKTSIYPCIHFRHCPYTATFTDDEAYALYQRERLCQVPCQHGGKCIAKDTCDCSSTGYTGPACETPVCTSPCQNGGRCVGPDQCDCAGTGYTGPTCSSPLTTGSTGTTATTGTTGVPATTGVPPTTGTGTTSSGTTGALGITCSARWQCASVSMDYNYVDCVNGRCACMPTFAGSGTPEDKCRCDKVGVFWDAVPYCLANKQCLRDWYGANCSGVCKDVQLPNKIGTC